MWRGIGRLAIGIECLRQVTRRLVALTEQVIEVGQQRSVDLEPDALELGDGLGKAVHLQQGEAAQIVVAGAGLVAANQSAVLREQGFGLASPAQLQQDVGQPPGQVDIVAASHELAGPPALNRVLGLLLLQLDQSLDQLDLEVVPGGRGNVAEVPPRRLHLAPASGHLGRRQPDGGARRIGQHRLIDLGRRPVGLVPGQEVAGPNQTRLCQLAGQSLSSLDQLIEDLEGLSRIGEPLGVEEGQPLCSLDVTRLYPLGALMLAGRFGQGLGVAVSGDQFKGVSQEAMGLGIAAVALDQVTGQGLGSGSLPPHFQGQRGKPTARLPAAAVPTQDLVVNLDRLPRLRLVLGPRGEELRLQIQRVEVVGVQLQVVVQVAKGQVRLLPLDPPLRLLQQPATALAFAIRLQYEKAGDDDQNEDHQEQRVAQVQPAFFEGVAHLVHGDVSSGRSASQLQSILASISTIPGATNIEGHDFEVVRMGPLTTG